MFIFSLVKLLLTLGLLSLVLIWVAIGILGYTTAKKTFKKYEQFKPIEGLDQKYSALVRTDFQ